jgi:hypothetical protein
MTRTGTYPFYNGVRDQPGFPSPDDIPTLPESFLRTGYATAAVLGSPVLARRFSLSRGFEKYGDHFGASTEEQQAGLPSIKRLAGPWCGWRWRGSIAGNLGEPFSCGCTFMIATCPIAPGALS